MRPVSVYAQVSDEQYQLLVSALHDQWRTAARIVMVLLSVHGWPASEIAALLHYHPGMVRRWIDRHDTEGLTGLPDRPRAGRPRIGGPRLGQRIRTLLTQPKAWTVPRIWRALGRPAMCQAPGLMESGLSGFQGCGDQVAHRVQGFVLGRWDVAELAV